MERGANNSQPRWCGLLLAALIAAALQGLIPVGYMPSFAGDGLRLVECYGYVRADESPHAHGHHHAVDGAAPAHKRGVPSGHDDHERMRPCAFAVAGHFAVDAPAPTIAPAPTRTAAIFTAPARRFEPRGRLTPGARGPPLIS